MGMPYTLPWSLKAPINVGMKSLVRIEAEAMKSSRGLRIERLARNGWKYRLSR
ncbi:hypothetical protein D3C72_2490710 [compost metagenome]